MSIDRRHVSYADIKIELALKKSPFSFDLTNEENDMISDMPLESQTNQCDGYDCIHRRSVEPIPV